VAALSVSGLPTERFCFLGYLPPRAGERRRAIAEVASIPMTLVLYEAPHRLAASLVALSGGLGAERDAVLCRELTKLHEEIVRGSLSELADWARERSIKGEITLVVAGARKPEKAAREEPFRAHAKEMYERLLAEGLSPEEATKRTREVFG
jgi:16S rRNA (cytidine1402-2'-O)-methyltransferase